VTKYWLLTYELVADYLDRRPLHRVVHLELAQRYTDEGLLVAAGAVGDPVETAALAFRADDRSVVEEFAREDPYVRNGLVTSWEVRPWTVVAGTLVTGIEVGSDPGT
jgi:uncharacterized protein YciI